ncbi:MULTISPECIES: pyrroline-5-carboxylate reductase [Pontibacillus]|uniref:Pyrroline-5-carboxylate reductase n=1 Tax=Pontibacillus chungwhensis TaxID=265426 RepID=A0ABY8USN0_9BACI|nr:pyrroline-5-carboxylate reductase [Pontibacillus chungwhensis]WIF96502.1 pyrroline-5-carboxylate reductase [Pontibacillus chungwhensis]
MAQTIAFLGAGSMAEAMISGMVQSKQVTPNQIIVSNRSNTNRLNELKYKYGIQAKKREQLDFEKIDLFILAMKPKDIDSVLESLKPHLNPQQTIISVLAGISTSYMEDHLPEKQQVIRVMPNTSSMIGESATAIAPGAYAPKDRITFTKTLMESFGEAYVIDEDQMDIFTGIAGSGPAYFYNLMEHIEQAGLEAGLDSEIARSIGAQTILGAAKMIQERDESPTELRENVTSPNGTTAAGLKALDKHRGGEAITAAIKGAATRSKEMAKQMEKPPLATH